MNILKNSLDHFESVFKTPSMDAFLCSKGPLHSVFMALFPKDIGRKNALFAFLLEFETWNNFGSLITSKWWGVLPVFFSASVEQVILAQGAALRLQVGNVPLKSSVICWASSWGMALQSFVASPWDALSVAVHISKITWCLPMDLSTDPLWSSCFSVVFLKSCWKPTADALSVYKALPASPPSVATANGHTSGLA